METIEIKSEELKVDTHEIDMILLEKQLHENNLRNKNPIIRFFRKLFKKNI